MPSVSCFNRFHFCITK